jgi:subtilase family serine protease
MVFEDKTIEKQGIISNGISNDVISTYPDTGLRSIIYAYDIPKLIQRYIDDINSSITLDTQKEAWKWVRILNERAGTVDVGSVQIYGKSVVTGSSGGVLYILDVETGDISSTIKNYEGMSAGPVIADGIMYGYGGNNKWNTSTETRFGTYIWMATPDGK